MEEDKKPEFYEGVEVKKFKAFGEPLTIKTCKQGRKVNLEMLVKGDKLNKIGRHHTKGFGEGVRKRHRGEDPMKLRLTAYNIIKHPKASPKQIEVAKIFLELYGHHDAENIRENIEKLREARKLAKYFDMCSLLTAIAKTLGKYK